MYWIRCQPNPLAEPEFYEPMADHDPPHITLSREARRQLGQVWVPDLDFEHPLFLRTFEDEDVSPEVYSIAREIELSGVSRRECESRGLLIIDLTMYRSFSHTMLTFLYVLIPPIQFLIFSTPYIILDLSCCSRSHAANKQRPRRPILYS